MSRPQLPTARRPDASRRLQASFLARLIVQADLGRPHIVAADTVAGGIPDDIRADYVACYDGDRFIESTHYVRRYPEERSCPRWSRCCRRSARRPRSSTAATTASSRSSTPSSSTSGCRIVAAC
jgi:hypothetical protein